MTARVQIIQDYRESMGGVEFNRVVEEEDDGLSYFLGLGLDTPLKVMKLTKKFLQEVWKITGLLRTSNVSSS